MLTRRQLRIKVFQALYAFLQSEKQESLQGERELKKQFTDIYRLYLQFLLLFGELRHQAILRMEEMRNKMLPSQADMHPNTRFSDNPVMQLLAVNDDLKREAQANKVSWSGDEDIVRVLFHDIRNSAWYKQYHESRHGTFEEDRKAFVLLFVDEIANSEKLLSFLEEKNVYWCDDIDLVCATVVKNIKQLKNPSDALILTGLWKNEQEDKSFAIALFNAAITQRETAQELIQLKAENWEVDRIAYADILIMTMAIAEAITFNNIPVKVTLNEYIEISKEYSTPRSHIFNNGILDKVFAELKGSGKIKKTGRGLIEN